MRSVLILILNSPSHKYVNTDLNCSILTLQEHDQFISAIEEIWSLKRQVTKFKFVMPQLIEMTLSQTH